MIKTESAGLCDFQRLRVISSLAHKQGVAEVHVVVACYCDIRATSALHDMHGLTVLRHFVFVIPVLESVLVLRGFVLFRFRSFTYLRMDT